MKDEELVNYIRREPVPYRFTYSKKFLDNYLKKTDKEAELSYRPNTSSEE